MLSKPFKLTSSLVFLSGIGIRLNGFDNIESIKFDLELESLENAQFLIFSLD